MGALIRLELRRNRTLFIASIGVLLLLVAVPYAMYKDGAPALLWSGLWVVMAQAVFGLVMGGRVASAESAETDGLVPLSPWRRAFAGLAAALLYGMVFALIAWSAGIMFAGTSQIIALLSENYAFSVSLAVLISTYACTYSFASGPIGLAAAAVPVGLLIAANMLVLDGAYDYGSRVPLSWLAGFFVALLAASMLGMLFVRAQTLALKPQNYARRNIAACCIALAGPLLALVCGYWSKYDGENRLLPCGTLYSRWGVRQPEEGGELLLASVRGAAAIVRPDGSSRRLLPPSYRGLAPLSKKPVSLLSAKYAADGSLWVLRELVARVTSSHYQVWRFGAEGSGALVADFHDAGHWSVLYPVKVGPPILSEYAGGHYRFAPLPEKGGVVKWREESAVARNLRLYEEGRALLLEGKSGLAALVDGKKMVCRLPLPPRQTKPEWGYPGFYTTGDKILFRLFLADKNFYSVSCRRSDGKVEAVGLSVGRSIAIAGQPGTWVPFNKVTPVDKLAALLSSSGHVFRDVRLYPLLAEAVGRDMPYAYVSSLRSRDNLFDFLVEAKGLYLVTVDAAAGKIVSKLKLSIARGNMGHLSRCYLVGDGFYLSALPNLYFVRWDGAVRRLPN